MQDERIDENLKEILDNLNKSKQLSKEQIQGMIYDIKERFDFEGKIDGIDLSADKYVIFVDGNTQLVYENGEFFLEDVIDKKKRRIKKKKSEARDLYIEYFIKYQLNPILKQKEIHGKVKTLSLGAIGKEKKVKKEGRTVKKTPVKKREKEIRQKNDDGLVR